MAFNGQPQLLLEYELGEINKAIDAHESGEHPLSKEELEKLESIRIRLMG